MERFQRLTEQQKEALREKLRAFKALAPEEQQRIRANLERWKNLPAGEKVRIRENFARFQKLNRRSRTISARGSRTSKLSPERPYGRE